MSCAFERRAALGIAFSIAPITSGTNELACPLISDALLDTLHCDCDCAQQSVAGHAGFCLDGEPSGNSNDVSGQFLAIEITGNCAHFYLSREAILQSPANGSAVRDQPSLQIVLASAGQRAVDQKAPRNVPWVGEDVDIAAKHGCHTGGESWGVERSIEGLIADGNVAPHNLTEEFLLTPEREIQARRSDLKGGGEVGQ